MTGTSSSLGGRKGGAGLPVPHVQLGRLLDQSLAAYNPAGVDYTIAATGEKMRMIRMPLFSAVEIPQELFDKDLRLEVLWYHKRQSKSRNGNSSGYVHPTHAEVPTPSPTTGTPAAPVLPRSRFRGGKRVNFDGFVTEWTVTKNGQKFFIDTLGLFFIRSSVSYADGVGSNNQVTAFIPSSNTANGGYSSNPSGFAYSARFRPNYFKFRFSIQDPNDPRARITGASTEVFTVAPAVHPFLQDVDASQTAGMTIRTINPAYREDVFNTWQNTRLPSGG